MEKLRQLLLLILCRLKNLENCCESGSFPIIIQYEEYRDFMIFEDTPSLTDSNNDPAYKSNIAHTITAQDGPGVYEVLLIGNISIEHDISPLLGVYVNNTIEEYNDRVLLHGDNLNGSDGRNIRLYASVSIFKSMITLNVGDTVGIGAIDISAQGAVAKFVNYKYKLTKISQ